MSAAGERLAEGRRLHREGETAAAEALYRELLAEPSTGIEASHLLGVLLSQRGEQAEGERWLRQAVEAAPGNAGYLFNLANNLKSQGRLEAAAECYREVLALSPEFLAAYNNLAAVAHAQGRSAEAKRLYTTLIKRQPEHAQHYRNLAVVLEAMGEADAAKRAFLKALSLAPRDPEALYRLGVVAQEEGDLERAEKLLLGALSLRPEYAEAHFTLGRVRLNQRRPEPARASFEEALRLRPDSSTVLAALGETALALGDGAAAEGHYREALVGHPDEVEAHFNLAVFLQRDGEEHLGAEREEARLGEAIERYRRVLEMDPLHGGARFNLGSAYLTLERYDEAVSVFRQLIADEPGSSEGYNNLGNAYKGLGETEQVLGCYEKAIALDGENAQAHYNLGLMLQELMEFEAADRSYQRAQALNPDSAETLNNRGVLKKELGLLGEAEAFHRQALAIDPEYPEAHCAMGVLLKEQGRLDEASGEYREALRLRPGYVGVHSNEVFLHSYMAGREPVEIFEEHRQWAAQHAAHLYPDTPRFANARDADRPLRVGFLSPDLRRHSVAYFIEPVFRGHDRQAYRLYAYSDACRGDAVTERLRDGAEQWRDTCGWSDERLVEQIREDAIDILVDLTGHTAGNRMLVFARRPAPLQVSYLGYPATTGLATMDYRLSDARADPEGMTEPLHSERLLRMPESFLCFEAPEEAPAVVAPPSVERGYVTFGSFNNLAKLTPQMVAVWAALLKRVPDSRLLLKYRSLADEGTRARFERLFAEHGVPAERLRLTGRIPSLDGHLGLYGEVDIALDTYPYHGTTTTCEALWMGVPVITLGGPSHVSRVGVSLLTGVGLEALVADDEADYIDRAAALAADPVRLAELRQGMRERMRGAPLMDEAAFNRALEGLLRDIWRGYLAAQDGTAV